MWYVDHPFCCNTSFAVRRQKAVSAYFTSKQILFALQSSVIVPQIFADVFLKIYTPRQEE